jgi:hypothetical protein
MYVLCLRVCVASTTCVCASCRAQTALPAIVVDWAPEESRTVD